MSISELYQLYLLHPYIQTDTRKLVAGDLFFALKGPNFNGNAYAAQAIEKGAAYAIIDESEYAIDERYILVADVLTTLQELARHHRLQFSIPFIAITGSNGKTTTKELIAAVLKQQFVTYATEGNLNNHIGIPLTILKIGKDADFAIIEMGANHQKEIEGYCKIALPTHGIITNAGKAHIEGFGGVEGVKKGKGELYDFLRTSDGTVFRNTDLDYLEQMAQGIGKQVTYGSAHAQYTGHASNKEVKLQVTADHDGTQTLIKTQLVGTYNFPNVMVAVAVGLHFGVTIDHVVEAIEAYNPDNSRSQWIERNKNRIILDAYNANPTSMQAAIQNFAGSGLSHKIIWLGGMKEMGTDELKEHKELIALVDQYEWEQVILVGNEFKVVKNNYTWFENAQEAAVFIASDPPVNKSILVKGSRGSRMELLLHAIPLG